MNRRSFLLTLGGAVVSAATCRLGTWPAAPMRPMTLVDWAKRGDHGKVMGDLVAILTQHNEFLDDLVFKTERRMTVRTPLPEIKWRQLAPDDQPADPVNRA